MSSTFRGRGWAAAREAPPRSQRVRRAGARNTGHLEVRSNPRLSPARRTAVKPRVWYPPRAPGGAMRSLGLAFVMMLLPSALAPTGSAPPPPSYEDLAVDLLGRYLRIDTTNPPGNELEAAHFFTKLLAAEGIEASIDEFAPGRANIMAKLEGSGRK